MTKDMQNRVVDTIDHQSSPKQPDYVDASTIVTVLVDHDNYDIDDVRKALDAAVDEGELVQDGDRYAIPEKA